MVPIKIAIYSGEIPSTTFIDRLVAGMAQTGYRIYLFGTLKKKKKYGKNVLIVGYANRFQKLVQYLYFAVLLLLFQNKDKKKLDRLLLQHGNDSFRYKVKYYPVLYYRPDIFHLQWAKGVGDWMWVQEFGMKFIVSLRGAHINYSPIADEQLRKRYAHCFPQVDGFHAVSKAIAFEAEKYNASLAKIKVVYSGLSMSNLDFENHSIINNPLKVVSIGRSHWKKGYSYALDGLKILQSQSFNFDYSIIGIGTDEELLLQRSQLGLEEKVRFVAPMPFEAVLAALREADVLLLPSVEEGIANVVLEAMALGTVVIATDCGGMKEVLTDGANGFLVPVRNPLALAEALQKVTALTVTDYQKLSYAARKTIEQQHSHAQMIAGMKTLYESVLNERS
ncbi:glycosyltransferase family 4 protein [Flavobacterium maritimum]|uniref:glycosyltransferase family 4 protein n=1 Tax=Flavobacterium maritimum TaxID=3149042 RepID=UPI0032B53A96